MPRGFIQTYLLTFLTEAPGIPNMDLFSMSQLVSHPQGLLVAA